MMHRVLLIEDNEDLALGLRNNLEIEGYAVRVAHTGAEGVLEIERGTDLLILDLMLPDTEGLKLLQQVRRAGFEAPVLVLTARGEEADKVRALKIGADDYLTKPFGLLELLARVEALLRRAPGLRADAVVHELGDLEIRTGPRQVLRGGCPVDLTPKEYDLLLALVEAGGKVASRRELLERVWGYRESVYTRTVDTHVAELRRKIEPDPRNPSIIVTVRKAGYRLATEAS
ncbi:MAG: response regulator transcription factor [Acidobacteriota bacterium]